MKQLVFMIPVDEKLQTSQVEVSAKMILALASETGGTFWQLIETL